MVPSRSKSVEERSGVGCFATGLVVLLVCLLAAWSVQERSAPSATPEVQPQHSKGLTPVPNFSRRAMTLAPGVHLLGELTPSAVYVIETDAGLILIDSGLDADAAKLSSQLTDLGMSVDQVRFILLTHVHADHSLGARRLRELSGAKICAGVDDSEELAAGRSRDAFLSTYELPDVMLHSTQIDVQLADGQIIELGDARVECLGTPGHTPGSFCYLLERNRQRILFTGDTVSSRTGELGTYAAYLAPRYRANASDYLASLRKLRGMSPPHLLLPGHPDLDRVGQSAEISLSGWHELLDVGITELEDLVTRLAADGRDFLDGVPKHILPGLIYLGDFHDWAIYCFHTPDRLVVIDAPGGPGLNAFVRDRLSQLDTKMPASVAVLLTACDEAATSGLRELMEQTDWTVVAPAAAFSHLEAHSVTTSRFMAAEDSAAEWFPVTVLPLNTLGESPAAYNVTWEGKSVLVSGRVPTRVGEGSTSRLRSALERMHGDTNGYLTTLRSLRTLNPDIWLPARPVYGQNANLYENEWKAILSASRNEFTAPE